MNDYQSLKKRLMEKTAKKLFCTPEELDQSQKVWVENQAWELAGLYTEMEQSNERIAADLVKKLRPEKELRSLPTFTVLQAKPNLPKVDLSKEDSFEYKTQKGDVFFSPLLSTILFKGAIKYKVSTYGVYEHNNKLTAAIPEPIHPAVCWLGIELDNTVTDLSNLSLFFNWDKQASEGRNLLHLAKLNVGTKTLKTKVGFQEEVAKTPVDFRENLWMKNRVEAPIKEHFESNFLTITEEDFLADLKGIFPLSKGNEPEPAYCQEKLLWLQILMPCKLSEAEIKSCAINCFPALNRKLTKKETIPSEEIAIVTLAEENQNENKNLKTDFLALDRIYTASMDYTPAMSEDLTSAPMGTYRLKHGRGKQFNLQDAKVQVADLVRLLKVESSIMYEVFKMEKRNDLENIVRNLEKNIHQLEAALEDRSIDSAYYFVYLKSNNNRENLWVHYWVMQEINFLTEINLIGELLSSSTQNLTEILFVNKLNYSN